MKFLKETFKDFFEDSLKNIPRIFSQKQSQK
jgi:hypothetical protein